MKRATRKFSRHTICLPRDLLPHLRRSVSSPEHAGNVSSYVRRLIIADANKPKGTAK